MPYPYDNRTVTESNFAATASALGYAKNADTYDMNFKYPRVMTSPPTITVTNNTTSTTLTGTQDRTFPECPTPTQTRRT